MDKNTSAGTSVIWFYRFCGVAALVLCWKENYQYMHLGVVDGVAAFVKDLWITHSSRSITIDICFVFVTAMVFVWRECRRLKMPGFWFYFLGALGIALSFTFPLFLAEREKRLVSESNR